MKNTEKKKYEPPVVHQIIMETVFGSCAANCKTAEPTGGCNVGGDCMGLIGSPPPPSGACSVLSS